VVVVDVVEVLLMMVAAGKQPAKLIAVKFF
jgi:hypothetical protein